MFSSVRHWAAAAALTVIVATSAWAAATTADGKWSWMQMGPNGDVSVSMQLKQDGEKLTGTVTRNEMSTEIKDGTIKDGTVSFVVVRERNGQEFKINYKGKLDGDTIKGNITVNFNGEDRMIDWTANRAK
jgi:hypothetical protein